jgi:flagellar FliJ protein
MAKKFKLQPVLRYREILEDQARQRLADSLEREKALRDRRALCARELEALWAELESKRRQGISVQDLILYEGHIRCREKHLKELSADLLVLEDEVAANREALCRAGQDRMLLEKLKEKKEAEEKEELLRAERAVLDEVALQFRKEDV